MKIFIAGASGLVGGNCFRLFSEKPSNQVAGSHFSFETDYTVFYDTLNPENPKNFDIGAFQPNVIVHCGALTHVDYCENHVEESYEKTVVSTINLVKLAKKHNAKLLYFSTDYVFDGKSGPYREDAPVNPLSVYGKHKLEAEQIIQKELSEYLILRITNVYGDEIRGKNFIARLFNQFQEGKTLEFPLPLDQYATPANAWDIARVAEKLIENNKNGIYHVGSTDYMNRYQLAMRVLSYFPKNKSKFEPKTTEALNQQANRPLRGGLLHDKFLEEFPNFVFSNVDDYLRQKFNSR